MDIQAPEEFTDAGAAGNTSRIGGLEWAYAELETANVHSSPGRIYGRRSGRKYFQDRGLEWAYAELETANVHSSPGRIYGRRSGRKYFQDRGLEWAYAELE